VLVDTHCHLDFEVFDADRVDILSACQKANITNIIIPSTTSEQWNKTLSICSEHHQLLPALGLHPYFIAQHNLQDLCVLEQKATENRLVAIGEIGLDFYLPRLDRNKQQQFFEAQLFLAKKLSLPVIIHARKAHQQVIESLRRIKPKYGIIHAFNGSLQQAHEYIKLDFKLGFGGAFTNPRAHKLRALVTQLPISSMVLETDAPDMTPNFASNKRNSPENLPQIFQSFISLRDEQADYLEQQLYKNSIDIFPEIPINAD